jgi:uncharacterized membrane protein YsdA (DUF1294 family)
MLYYLLGINGLALLSMMVDKSKAMFKAYRIPERYFMTLAFLGGGFGVILGMILFRHKIRKPYFTVWIPFVTVIVTALGTYGWFRFVR